MSVTILTGDCREMLDTLPAGSAQTCATSPPYFGLRDYGHEGQIGLERSVDEYVDALVSVFRAVRRVLADDGTLWLNLGDSYVSSATGGLSAKPSMMTGGRANQAAGSMRPDKSNVGDGLKTKDLIGIPWRVAFALQQDGWYLRSDIVWHKPNPMPESVTDRPTKAHEYLFLLTKAPRYYYDAAAIAEPVLIQGITGPRFGGNKYGDSDDPKHATKSGNVYTAGETRNRRSVWTVATQPYSGAHFATFPPKLIEPCILAGSSEKGECPACGKAWVRVVERESAVPARHGDWKSTGETHRNDIERKGGFYDATTTTKGWAPSCACDAGDPVPQTVLDPFGGAGTTGLVADRLNRDAVLVELNPEYAQMARDRIYNDAPLFASVGGV